MSNVKVHIQNSVNQIFNNVKNTETSFGKFELLHLKLHQFFCTHYQGGFRVSLLKTGIVKVKVIVNKKEYNYDIEVLDINQLKTFN